MLLAALLLPLFNPLLQDVRGELRPTVLNEKPTGSARSSAPIPLQRAIIYLTNQICGIVDV